LFKASLTVTEVSSETSLKIPAGKRFLTKASYYNIVNSDDSDAFVIVVVNDDYTQTDIYFYLKDGQSSALWFPAEERTLTVRLEEWQERLGTYTEISAVSKQHR
jgi:hypothetical protein